jgi:hypothetical protein
MRTNHQKTVRMRGQFSGSRRATNPALENLGRIQNLTVNILRGRFSQEKSDLELEVTGPLHRIKDFIRRSRTWAASVGNLSFSIV